MSGENMGSAVGIIELSSIARGVKVCDAMLKAAYVEIFHSGAICPGKYLIVVSGETSEVESSMEAGRDSAEKYLKKWQLIPNLHQDVIAAIRGKGTVEEQDAVGVLEFTSVTEAIHAADTAVKTAAVRLIRVQMGRMIGGKGTVVLAGDLEAVEAAVDAVKKQGGKIVETTVIAHPEPRLLKYL